MPSNTIAAAPSATEISTSTEAATGGEWNVKNDTSTGAVFETAKTAMTIENASARKTISCDTGLPIA